MPTRDYTPPKLNRRVTVRRESDRPGPQQDRFGNLIPVGEYGAPAWAARRDVRARADAAEGGVAVEATRVIFTVRYASTLANRADISVIDEGGTEYISRVPLERGRRGAGASHLELVCDARL